MVAGVGFEPTASAYETNENDQTSPPRYMTPSRLPLRLTPIPHGQHYLSIGILSILDGVVSILL
jgi:hypothetical protein